MKVEDEPLQIQEKVVNIIIIKIEMDSMTRVGHMREIEVRIGTIRISEVGTRLKMIGIEINILEVIGETLRTGTGHMREVKQVKRQWRKI